jgi:hypothetical protein
MIKIAVGNVGHEELDRMLLQKDNRASSRAAARALFPSVAEDGMAKDSKLMKKLFVQTPGAETMAPTLEGIHQAKTAAVDAFFAKYAGLTEAQRRFPELLKVAKPTPNLKKRNPEAASGPTGEPPVQSTLSGGAS